MRVRLDLAAKKEIHQAALFYEDCREGLGQEFVDSAEGKEIRIAAVMHLKRKPGYWVSRGKS